MNAQVNTQEILDIANEIVKKHGLTAELMGDLKSVGVQGDRRTHLPTLCLVGTFPGYETLEKLSTVLTDSLQINRVIFETARR